MKSPRLHLARLVAAVGPLAQLQNRAPSSDNKVIVQMFGWNWDSLAAECTNFIGPAGYGYVQTGPPQESITGDSWWIQYQAVSYKLESKYGTREQYKNMIDTCHAAGVKVMADTVFNHMAGIDSGTGTAGSSFTHYNYPGIYQDADFHHCGTPGDDIADYNDRFQVQTCELSNLADLNTGSESVRAKIASYGNDLLSLGVDGLRIDAAKHVNPTELSDIVSRLSRKPSYITQETAYGGEIKATDFVGIGDAQEFRYTSTVANAFLTNGISTLQNVAGSDWVPSASANVFISNHDTERGGTSLTYQSKSNVYNNAHVFMLAYPYGTPTVLSSYAFSSETKDASSPNGGAGSCSTNGGSNGWLCQHRTPAIAGMVAFHNTVGNAAVAKWTASGTQRIAFGRGTAGFVAINNEDTAWTVTFSSSLAPGTYCDAISGGCSTTFTVGSDGKFSATVPARNSIALHTGAIKK